MSLISEVYNSCDAKGYKYQRIHSDVDTAHHEARQGQRRIAAKIDHALLLYVFDLKDN